MSLERAYGIHGVGLTIRATSPELIAAMDLRLRDFAIDPEPEPSATGGLRFDFLEGPVLAPPAGTSCPLYQVADGSLRYFPDLDVVHGRLDGVGLHCELSRERATFSCEAFTGHSLYLATHPLATVALMELLERRGLFSLHAACLSARDGDGILLAGPSGAGKSTLALALVRAGMDFLSDDIVFLSGGRESGPVRALGFSDAVGLTGRFTLRFGEMDAEPAPEGFPRRLRRIEDLFGVPALAFCEPRAVVFSEVVDARPTRLAPLPAGEAFVKLVPDVLLSEPRASRAHLETISSLLDQAACYTLRLGRNLDRAVALVRELV